MAAVVHPAEPGADVADAAAAAAAAANEPMIEPTSSAGTPPSGAPLLRALSTGVPLRRALSGAVTAAAARTPPSPAGSTSSQWEGVDVRRRLESARRAGVARRWAITLPLALLGLSLTLGGLGLWLSRSAGSEWWWCARRERGRAPRGAERGGRGMAPARRSARGGGCRARALGVPSACPLP